MLACEKGDVINKSQFSVMTLQREACSSREAVYYTLKNMLQKEELATPPITRKSNS